MPRSLFLSLALACAAVAPALAQSPASGDKQRAPLVAASNAGPTVYDPVVPQTSRPLLEVARAELGVRKQFSGEINPRGKGRFTPAPPPGKRPADALAEQAQRVPGRDPVPGPLTTFEGMNQSEGCGGCQPPDPVIAVGPNHIVEMVNVAFSIYLKDGSRVVGPSQISALWAGQTGACATSNTGDPIAVFDEMADRWLLSQFFRDGICVAVSQTDDPTGTYNLYQFDLPEFPDYFKIGAWPSSYFVGANETGYGAYAFDRQSMIAGNPAGVVRFADVSPNFVLPADVDGSTPPAGGSPGVFYTFLDSDFHGVASDRVTLYAFDIDWANAAAATFTETDVIPVTPFNFAVCGFFNFSCIPQGGTAQRVDAVSEWPMQRFIYRDFGAHKALAGTFTVDATGASLAGLRWFELRENVSGWALHQEGTYAPNDGLHRWMGSLAFDDAGSLAIGYSASSPTERPSLRYTYRQAGDPLGALLDEAVMVQGDGSQSSGNRWGDYSALALDPVDGRTFWYVGEYVPSGSSWSTRIGSFQATTPDLALGLTALPTAVTAGEEVELMLTVTAGPNALSGVEVEADVPAGAAYVAGSASCGGAYDAGTETVTFAIGQLAASGSQVCTFRVETDPSTSTPAFLRFQDDHEDGPGGWTATAGAGSSDWAIRSDNPFSGTNSWFAADVGSVSDQYLTTAVPIVLSDAPTLTFRHAYDLELGYDGGVVELSADAGATWTDLGTAIVQQGYDQTIPTCCSNPIGGRQAFSGDSGGYILTEVDLSAFAGQSVLLRFRLATDFSVGDVGWDVDDVRIFQDGVVSGAGTLSFAATATASGGISENGAASVLVTAETDCAAETVSTNGPVSFVPTEGAVAVDVVFAGVAGSGDVRVCRVGAPSSSAVGIEEDERMSHFWTVEVDGGLQFSDASEFRFDVSAIPYSSIQNASLLTGYVRPAIGTGPFSAAPTTFDGDDLVVTGIGQSAAAPGGDAARAFVQVAEVTFGGATGTLPVELTAFDGERDQQRRLRRGSGPARRRRAGGCVCAGGLCRGRRHHHRGAALRPPPRRRGARHLPLPPAPGRPRRHGRDDACRRAHGRARAGAHALGARAQPGATARAVHVLRACVRRRHAGRVRRARPRGGAPVRRPRRVRATPHRDARSGRTRRRHLRRAPGRGRPLARRARGRGALSAGSWQGGRGVRHRPGAPPRARTVLRQIGSYPSVLTLGAGAGVAFQIDLDEGSTRRGRTGRRKPFARSSRAAGRTGRRGRWSLVHLA